MDDHLPDIADRLLPLLIDTRNMLKLHDRAGEVGITMEAGFVRSCQERWEEAISGVRESEERIKGECATTQ